MNKVKPLLPKNPTAEDLINAVKIINYLIPEVIKRGRKKEAAELKIKRDLYNLMAEVMTTRGHKNLDEGSD